MARAAIPVGWSSSRAPSAYALLLPTYFFAVDVVHEPLPLPFMAARLSWM
ncbi:hypothetical protein AB0O76_33085 [Streptomyces sp. NPDC086554]